jgi:hypothetical protein
MLRATVSKRIDHIKNDIDTAYQRAIEALSDDDLEVLANCADERDPTPKEKTVIDALRKAVRRELHERLN